jgi:hypothetical protein
MLFLVGVSIRVSRRRVRRAQCKAEVLHGHAERIKDLGVNGVLIEVNKLHFLADLLHSQHGGNSISAKNTG